MPDKKGRFQKGERLSRATEFKQGEHWREEKPFWNREWLQTEYVDKQRSAAEIANEFGVTEAAIFFWMRKHNIPRRTVSEAREVKHWGLSGEVNGMFGRKGEQNPRWRGGVTPERQALYSSTEWARAVRAVWKRDKGYCQRCGQHYTVIGEMHIHHLVSFAVKELRTEVLNLLLICEPCHNWIHSKDNIQNDFIREYDVDDSGSQ